MAWVSSSSSPSKLAPMARRATGLLAGGGTAWLVVIASLGLFALGVHAIDVASRHEASGPLGSMAAKQLVLGLIGMGAGLLAALPHYRALGWASFVLYAIMLGLLVFLLIPFVPTWIVKPRNGARGWIDLGPVDFQPAELAKVAYVLALAWYLRYSTTHRTLRGLLPPAIVTGIPVALIILQPDLGTASLFVPVLFAVLVAAGARLKHLVLVVALATMSAPAAYPLLKPHQKQRIAGLVQQVKGDTSADEDINMQSVTAQRLIGTGGIGGLPTDRARRIVHYSRLPERHNDMVVAVILARFGLVGGVAVLGLYALWIAGAFLTAATIREPFARLVIVGFAAFVAAQVFVNLGMNVGLLPIVGITLPFVSYGGSSMATGWIMVGIILGIAVRRAGMPTRRSFEYADDEE